MPRNKKYENNIPAFYRKSTIDIMLFAHVTAIREREGADEKGNYLMSIEEAIDNFYELYSISPDEFPIESAITTYHRVKNNFLFVTIQFHLKHINDKLDLSNK